MNGVSSALFIAGTTLAQAPAAAAQPNLIGALGPILLIVVIFYFLMIRPQQKKQKMHQAMISQIKNGDEVVTAGGMFGTVAGVDERKNTVYLKVANDVKIKVERHSIARVVQPDVGDTGSK
jgi:preprotein translocase subunit YajC